MAEQTYAPGDLDSWVVLAIGKLVEELYNPEKLQRFQEATAQAVAKGQTIAAGASVQGALSLAEGPLEIVEKAEKVVQALVAPFIALIVGHMLGIEVDPEALKHAASQGAGGPIGQTVASFAMKAMSAPEGPLEPNDERARDFLASLANFTLQGWFEGILLEHVISEIPGQEAIEETAKLAKGLIQSLGLSRLARTGLRPLVRTCIATPLEWKVNKTYRPTLASPATAIGQFHSGLWSLEQLLEELARQGYDDTRITALINEQRKLLSPGDVNQLVSRGFWTADEGRQHLRLIGYDAEIADLVLRIEGTRRIEQQDNALASALVTAYAQRDIDDAQLARSLDAFDFPASERALITELARTRLALNIRPLSPAETEEAVRLGVLNILDYRLSLLRAGYTDEGATVKELVLRAQLDEKHSIAEHRARLEADRAAQQAQRDAERAVKLKAVDQARAAARRGDEGDLEDAAIRGLIPFARVEEVYRTHYDDDTVGILLDRLEGKRQDYLAAQQRAKDAAQRVSARGLSTADLTAAVVAGVLTVDDFRRGLSAQGVSDADVDVLARTLEARLATQRAAEDAREQARKAATARNIDLGRYEQLVRRGVRTLAQYGALLQTLGFNVAAVADMSELLKLQLTGDAAAQAAREQADATLRARGLSLEEWRRAVILGLKSLDAFAQFLLDQKFTADKQELLLTELQQAVDDAEAARARRDAGGTGDGSLRVPLATLARAARLGLISPERYRQRLIADGYDDGDVLLQMDLLATEIADVQAARAVRDAAPPATAPKGLTLGELATAVKKGLRTLGDYAARAGELGLSDEAIATQTRILGDEVLATDDAKARRTAVAGELAAKRVALADLEAPVRAGAATLDDYARSLVNAGVLPDDAALLAAVLEGEIAT